MRLYFIECAVERFDHGSDHLHSIMGRVELALLLGGIDRKLFQEVFVDPTDQVFFLAKLLVADFVYLIHNFLDVVGCKVPCGKCTLNKTAF